MSRTDKVGIFVYGTLKQNQLRGSLWPRPPIAIGPAITLGELWDLGSYPGMHPGSDWVLGELWIFRPEDIKETFRVLDEIEEYDPKEDCGLYLRRQIDVRGVDAQDRFGPLQKAFTYLMPPGSADTSNSANRAMEKTSMDLRRCSNGCISGMLAR